MKRKILILPLCSFVLYSPIAAMAGDAPETGVMLTPEQIGWVDNPRVPGLGLAKILGDAKQPGPFFHRVKFPTGRVVQAHSHPDDRTYTVLTGTWYIGWGETYDAEKLAALPAGGFYTERSGSPALYLHAGRRGRRAGNRDRTHGRPLRQSRACTQEVTVDARAQEKPPEFPGIRGMPPSKYEATTMIKHTLVLSDPRVRVSTPMLAA